MLQAGYNWSGDKLLINRVFKEAEPILTERRIDEVAIGLTVAVVSLDNGNIGSCLILHEEMKDLHEVFFSPEELKGMPALEMAQWAVNPEEHPLRKTLGIAAINACAASVDLSDARPVDASKAIRIRSSDTVGFIGYIPSLVSQMEEKAKKVLVYDNGLKGNVLPPETQALLLPLCDIVYITGTTFVNDTIDELLNICRDAREIIIVGPTTPMFPQAYEKTNVTIIAGGTWKKEYKKDIFARVMLNAGIPTLARYLNKLSLRIR